MFSFYQTNNFKLFKCRLDKSPDLLKNESWRAESSHLSIDQVERIVSTGGFIGAWLPKNYIVIDIDVKGASHKHDGMQPFKDLCIKHNIEGDLLKRTLVVKTGSGGFHLYFRLPEGVNYEDISQKSLEGGLDIRTHLGYVIAAGTNGYTVINKVEPIEFPEPFLKEVKRKAIMKAEPFNPERILPIKELKAVLKKVDVNNFDTNDTWQEFVTSIIATSGNTSNVLDTIEEWSSGDIRYIEDRTIRSRLETFEPDGGITAGTFLYTIKSEISKYLYTKIRMIVGKEFNFSKDIADNFNLPFKVDYSYIHEEKETMGSFYYKKHQTFGADLFARLVEGNLYYVQGEKVYYYFNGTYWVETAGIQHILFTAFLRAGLVFYTDFSEGKDDDADEYFNEYVTFLGSLSMLQKFEQNLRQHPLINIKEVPWDSPDNSYTLTLKDCVMDYTGEEVIFRKSNALEYRRLHMDLSKKDFLDNKPPIKFKEFLAEVFPDKETRKTATYALSTMLSGSGKFRKFQIWNGSGNNGKSALVDIMSQVIGKDRAIAYTPENILTNEKISSLTPELALFRGALLTFASETNEFKRISEGAVKRITGDEPITANPKFQRPIQFHTTWQTVLSTNHLPEFGTHDSAFINRLLILPFHAHFYEDEDMRKRAEEKGSRYFMPAKDPVPIKEDIVAERASILLYLANRLIEINKAIPESPECLEAKQRYIKDNNSIMELVSEMLEFDKELNYFTPTRDLVNFYNEDQNVAYSSKFIVNRVKDVYPFVENHTKSINGKLVRGLKNIRLIYGAYPEGYQGNFTDMEISKHVLDETEGEF